MPDALPKATDAIPSHHPLHRAARRRAATPTQWRATSTSASASDPDYGRLSGQRPDQVEEQEPNALKEDPRDFALWKANKPGEDTAWDSPWGRGRPGWHIECSAMAEDAFGPVFEIHGGGLDLVFPHHENELAQSLALGHEFARVWMHNGMVGGLGGEKMSKSLGNDVSLRNVLDTWGREVAADVLPTARTGGSRSTSATRSSSRRRRRSTRFRNFFLDERARRRGRGDDPRRGARRRARRRLQHAGGARALARVARSRGVGVVALGARSVRARVDRRRPRRRRRSSRRSRSSGARRATRRTSRESDRLRDEIAAAGWEVRDVAEPPGYRLVRRS